MTVTIALPPWTEWPPGELERRFRDGLWTRGIVLERIGVLDLGDERDAPHGENGAIRAPLPPEIVVVAGTELGAAGRTHRIGRDAYGIEIAEHDQFRSAVYAHEFGHVLGQDHGATGIMRPPAKGHVTPGDCP